ncbi:MAG: HAMP domain-containing histidine kinase [Muribaculaceae bacterium]|nr:HAMP domain-containing histidine kinase [Muribaculaceae bacterium]
MGLKKPTSYQWRLFFPLVALLWFTIAAMVTFQHKREKTYRSETIKQQLEFINSRVVFAYEHNADITPFNRFINDYFSHSVYKDVRVSVYNTKTDNLLFSFGDPIKHKKTEADKRPNFYYSEQVSHDGNVIVYTAMPYTVSLAEALAPDSTMWITIITLAIIVTIIAFGSTYYIGKTVKFLRDFAKQAATEKDLTTTYKFPKDELGDVSQQIINLFNSKTKAIEDSEKEHKVALAAIEEKSRMKRELTNNISHEIKTPVGIIKGYIDTIADDPNMSDDTKNHFITKTQEQINRLCDLLNDISTITRLSETTQAIPTEKLNFHDIVYTIANDVKESGMLKGMEFSFDIPLNCYINGNNALLNSTILNLIKNSVAYSRGTQIRLFTLNDSFDSYTFRYYDNGTGVEEEHIPYLFDRFYRIDAGRSRKAGGTGLGLPIVKNTILTHGGKITVRNRPQGGLEFTFTLPKF